MAGTGNSIDQAAHLVGQNVSIAEADLMAVYSAREGDPNKNLTDLAKRLNLKIEPGTTPDLKGLQLIAERRYQHSNQIYNMFSSLLDKMDQMKQRLIQKFSQG